MAGDLPADFSLSDYIDTLLAEPKKVATRKASEMALEAINVLLPETVGGSADLTGSNHTKTKSTAPFSRDDYSGRYVRSEAHTSELQSIMRIPYAAFCLTHNKQKKQQ